MNDPYLMGLKTGHRSLLLEKKFVNGSSAAVQSSEWASGSNTASPGLSSFMTNLAIKRQQLQQLPNSFVSKENERKPKYYVATIREQHPNFFVAQEQANASTLVIEWLEKYFKILPNQSILEPIEEHEAEDDGTTLALSISESEFEDPSA